MRKKIIIITSSLVVLALLVVVAINAQTKTQDNSTSKTEQCTPDKCKSCPSAAKCAEGVTHDASACVGQKTAECDSKSCDKAATCEKDATCDHKKAEAAACPSASTCKKDCPSKK